MVRFRLLGYLLVALIFPTALQAAGGDDQRLADFFRNYLEEEFKRHPVDATMLGDHRFDAQMDDLSAKARQIDVERTNTVLAELRKQLDPAKLSRDGQIDLEILQHHLKKTLWLAENTRPYEIDPRWWNTYISDSVYLVLTQNTGEKVRNVRNAAARIEAIPRVVASARETLKNPPRVYVETAIKQNRGAIAFYEKGIYGLTGETPQVSVLAKPCQLAVKALKEYQQFLEEDLLPRAQGEWRIGKDRFAQKLDLELDAGISADEVLKVALAEADRVRAEMYVIARQLWCTTFPGKALPADDELGRRQTIQIVLAELGKNHGKPENLVADGRATIAEIKQFIRAKDILRLPEPDRCDVIEMPEFQRGNSTAYLSSAPPLDPKANSVYAISPPPKEWDDRRVQSYLQEYNSSMLKILTIHEAYPGHYVQLEYANRHPSLIRKVLSSGVFIEGWAVYTEQMMLDQGFGNGDLSMRLHQLKWYLRAVVNAILDHQMHCTAMSDAEALKLLMEGAFQTEGEAVGKIIRAKQSSCQLSTYFVGRLAHYRLRQQTARRLGEEFDLGRYHEAVLAHGSVPVKYLPELVAERLKKPR